MLFNETVSILIGCMGGNADEGLGDLSCSCCWCNPDDCECDDDDDADDGVDANASGDADGIDGVDADADNDDVNGCTGNWDVKGATDVMDKVVVLLWWW